MTLEIELAKKEIKEQIWETRRRYGVPACVAEGILHELIAGLKEESRDDMLDEAIKKLKEKDEELEGVMKEAKRVLKNEPNEEQTEQGATENLEEQEMNTERR